MKSILFVIDSLTCGGAEKSLISLLNNMDYSKYKVDILMFSRGGAFEKYLPKEVNILDIPKYFKFVSDKKNVSVKNIKYWYYRVKTSIKLRINNIRKVPIHSEQVVYKSIKNILYKLDKRYHVAIAYSQGFPTYFVSEKVEADKKISWINCNYIQTKYDKDLDNKFYNKIDKIVVVSKFIYDSMAQMQYGYKEKMRIILDIVDPKLIIDMALEEKAKELEETTYFKILTVGRLATVKGYDLAVNTAKLLRESKLKFKWFIIGEGPQRKEIEDLIQEHKLENEVILLGAKTNPYPYMKECDLYVQTSRKEGFGLTVIEAKILKKVIVTTNFDTVNELLSDKFDGIIVDKDENSIYEAINNLINNVEFYNKIKRNIESLKLYSSTKEIYKFYEEIS